MEEFNDRDTADWNASQKIDLEYMYFYRDILRVRLL